MVISVKLQTALNELGLTASDVEGLADEILNKECPKLNEEINPLMDNIGDNINNLTNDTLREYEGKITKWLWTLIETKEKATIRASISESLRKEKYAENIIQAEGSVATKESQATLLISEQIVVEEIYDLISSTLKSKYEALRKTLDTLQSIIVSRLSEAKLSTTNIGAE